MARKPTYEELEQRVKGLEKEVFKRKQAEEALKESRNAYKTTFETTGTAMLIGEEDTTISMINVEFEKLCGYSKEEVEGKKSWIEFIVKADLERMKGYHNLRMIEPNAAPPYYEFQFIDKHGNVRYCLITLSLIPGTKKTVGSLIDITDRKQAEEALSRRSKEFAALYETSLDITMPHDLPTLLETIVERAVRLLNGTSGGMYRCDPERKEVRCVVSYNTLRDHTGTVLKYGEGAAGTVAQTKEPLIIDDYRTWSSRSAVFEKEQPFSAVISVPMIWQGEVFGVIHVLHDVKTRRFTQADLKLLTLFANQAVIAIQNSRLVEQVQSHSAELQRRLVEVEERTHQLKKTTEELQREIEERKQAEKSLQQSEERYRTLVEESFDGIFVQKGPKIIFVNQRLNEMLGYEKDELVGLDHWLVYHPDYQEITRKRAQARMRGEKTTNQYEVKLQRKDGSWFYGEINARAISLEKEPGIQVWVRDITERKQAEDTLRESEEKYRTILESIEEGYYEVDIAGNFTFVNDSQCKMLGYSRDEIIGMNYRKYMDKKDATKVYQGFNRVYKTGIPSKILDWELIREDATKKFVEISVSLIKDSEGNPTGFRGILRDVTERKQAEEALKESEEKYRTLSEQSTDAIYITTKEGKLSYINRSFLDLFGYTKEEIEDLKAQDMYVNLEDRSRFQQETEKTGAIRDFEVKLRKKDGTEIDCLITANIRKADYGSILGYQGIIRDITEKQNLQAQLIQAQKMEAIGTLAGGIAHNFNNLLMSIQGNASLMLLDTDSNHPHYQRLTNIEKLVQSGSKLTSQLLGYARGGRYEVKPISMNQIIKETSATFSMTKKDITIHQDLDKDLYGVKADLGQIEQVLLNIYVNAAEAMPGGGDLFLHTINVTHKDIKKKPYKVKPREYILLTIRDTGIGMDKNTKDKVFDPFFTTKGLAKGTGLGLASVYGIIKAHGGYIDVESKKGQGTTFYIYLPASKAEGITQRAESESGVEIIQGKETVLLVDDEEIIIDVGQELLKTLGYKVLIAEGGREAVDIYKANKDNIDIVILDMIMPVIGGGETYDRMKEINPNIKVLLSSGYSINGQATEILRRGCNGFIQKPFTMRELSKAIREVLEKR